MSDNPQRQAPWLSIGHGGWTLHFPTIETASGRQSSRLSHYGNTWREHLHEIAPDAIGTDVTVIPDDDLVTFAVSGPMGDPDVPAGMVRTFGAGLVPWRDEPQDERDPRFGNARSLDYVALDVYVELARRFGARVFSPHEEVAA